ncbi:Rho GTPase-activating protein 20 [Myotis davidii]|uniref:Rho GTPase-activating protein 20 n=1 Tax=Myotis davidii TaxID=225400 RepID=L5M4Z8_MYODS|nr:Rho GTPase-activating protein 20 [Myotis davidii]
MFGLILNLIRYINLAKEKDQLKSLPLNIVTEDIKNCAPDFLRNIPGSIFSRGVSEQWLSVVDEGNEEKITASQRLLELLPRANAVLLRHLSGLLHSIQQHSFTNQMTAGNLGMCLTPSIFCLPIPCTSDLRKDLRKKSDLAQFLIQIGLKIFGEDITSLCGESPMSSDNGKKSAFTSKGGFGISGKQSPSLPEGGGDAQMVQQSTC